MMYLMEHELGYDRARIGFPSIFGCNALLYSTDAGLFGYHAYGGSKAVDWNRRCSHFAAFVQNCCVGQMPTGFRLYSVTFANDQRGYGGDSAALWRQEVAAYAAALNFTGACRGYNLSRSAIDGSAYVEFRGVMGGKCEIWTAAWQHAQPTTQPIANRMVHKMIWNGNVAGTQTSEIRDLATPEVTAIPALVLQHVHSERLTKK